MSSPTYKLEFEFSAGVWTDLIADVIKEPIRGSRGINGAGPLDRIAGPGWLTFSLDNTDQNDAGVASRYSPGHANAVSGFRRKTAVRLHVDDGTNAKYIWRGYLDKITPDIAVAGLRVTEVSCVGWFGYFAEYDAADLALREAVTSDELMDDLVDSLPRQPANRDFDTGLDEYEVAFDDLGSSPKALPVANDILTSGLEYLYEQGDATDGQTLRMENRHARALASVDATFVGAELADGRDVLLVPDDPDLVYNDIEVQVMPRRVNGVGVNEVIFSLDGAVEVPAGQTREVWIDYQDPDNEAEHVGLIGGGVTMALNTDYTVNSAQDGGGSDLSGSVSVAATFFGSRAKVTAINSGTSSAWVRGPGSADGMQGRGRLIRRYRSVGVKGVNQDSIDDYGSRQLPSPLLMPYQQNLEYARGAAEFIAYSWGVSNVPRQMKLPSETGGDYLAYAINLDVGSKIAVSEDQTGVDAAPCIIHRLDFEVQLDGRLFMEYLLAPADPSDFMIWDDPVAGVWDANLWGFF